MTKKRHFKQSKEQRIAAQEIPKYILSAFGEEPYSKCLTHIVVSPDQSNGSLDSAPRSLEVRQINPVSDTAPQGRKG